MMRRQLEERPRARRAGGGAVGVGGRDLRALRLRHRGARREPDRPPPRRRGWRRAPAGGRPAAGRAGRRPRRAHARGLRARARRSARACSTAPGRGGTCASTTPSRGATARSRCRPSPCPTATRSTPCAPAATTKARRARSSIRELVAATPAARALLWDFLLDQDLTRTVTWTLGPARRAAVADAHRSRRRAHRPRGGAVGAPRRRRRPRSRARALRGRPRRRARRRRRVLPWNAGRYRLAGGGCERTDAEPDLALDAAALGAAYLGGTTLRPSWRRRAASPSCARARWRARLRPSAPTSRRGVRRSSEG